MKKLLLSATVIITALLSNAQTQVPNGDFENWSSFAPCSGIDSLHSYYTPDIDYYYFTEDRDGTGSCLSYPTTIKTTDKYTGTYALKLIPVPVIGIPTPLFTGNAVLISKFNNIENNPTGVPFTENPTKLIGYYKFNNGGSDTLGIMVSTSVTNATEPILFGEFATSVSQNTFTRFEIDLTQYDLATAEVLDLSVSFGNVSGYANQNSYIIIDALTFEYTTTATTTASTTSPINVYTTQKDINFSNEVSDVVIYNLVGSQELAQTTATKTVNAAALKNGLYVVTYKYNDNFYSKKVVVD